MALSAAVGYGKWRARPPAPPFALDLDTEDSVRRIASRLRRQMPNGGWVAPEDLAALLQAIGVPFARIQRTGLEVDSVVAAAEEIGYPVVLKAVAPGLLHKSDVGGVAVGIDSAAALRQAAADVSLKVHEAGVALEGFLVQRQVERGLEALVGVTTDPSLGPLLVAGLGGVHVELFRDVSFRLTPVSELDVAEMLDSLKSRALLDGFRGSPPADREALKRTILRIGGLVEIMPELLELDLNPVMVLGPGKGAIAVDGRLRLAAEK
jgi:acyl-CoA synthetase (NDP forming)